MSIVKRLQPKIPPRLRFGQCTAPRSTVYARDKDGKPKRCQHGATWSINGKRYCAKHAGQLALQILCGEKA